MKQRLLRFTEHDDARLQARADAVGISSQSFARQIVLRELNGIDSATVVREELEREHAFMRSENERFQEQLLEIVIALRDSLRNSQTELLEGFREAIAGKSSGQSGLLKQLHGHRT